jgi:hypothetical protein
MIVADSGTCIQEKPQDCQGNEEFIQGLGCASKCLIGQRRMPDGQCVTIDCTQVHPNAIWKGGQCVINCGANGALVGKTCQCNDGYEMIDNLCTKKPKVCPSGSNLNKAKDDCIACSTGTAWSPIEDKSISTKKVCATGSYLIGTDLCCEGTLAVVGGSCIEPTCKLLGFGQDEGCANGSCELAKVSSVALASGAKKTLTCYTCDSTYTPSTSCCPGSNKIAGAGGTCAGGTSCTEEKSCSGTNIQCTNGGSFKGSVQVSCCKHASLDTCATVACAGFGSNDVGKYCNTTISEAEKCTLGADAALTNCLCGGSGTGYCPSNMQ